MMKTSRLTVLLHLSLLSSIGIFLFFIPIEIQGKSSILVDHISQFFIHDLRSFSLTFLLCLIIYNLIHEVIKGSYKTSLTHQVLFFIKIIGFLLSILYLTNTAPHWLMEKDMLPFLFEKLAFSVGILIPIGALALTFLIGFGLMEFVGVFLEPFMRPLFRTPGASAIDAVASFVGSYSIGLLITDRVYQKGQYSLREATIIATGFSTVSATFMIIVAKTLDLMNHWNFFFWSCLVITFIVTSITAYLPPITQLDNQSNREEDLLSQQGNYWQRAITTAKNHYQQSPRWYQMVYINLKDGLAMSATVAPAILAIGLIGLLISKHTPLFDWVGILLKPALWITGFDITQYAGELATGLAEMFLPALLVKDGAMEIRYITSIVSISSILFLSGSIPCILATKIPISFPHLIMIWFWRTFFSIILASLSFRLGVYLGWI
ncbi:YjiH family protein [Pelistega sp. NLN82]|uniref:YjiH family protein n=1 Tax=Pelistega ratti TaxID=2652177 RepID=A0A6L9Y6G4_9BURK|nr:YjiH family protein [Pelistega ratti]NEN75971.1 YjiH family protein [Pelistega ratti]